MTDLPKETTMIFRTITNPAELPSEAADFKKRHFQEVFGELWGPVYDQSPTIADGEEVLVAEIAGRPAGWVHYRRQPYCLKFRGFAVHSDFRGQGVARLLLQELTNVGIAYHRNMTASGAKPTDIGLMFLKSLVYFDADRDGEVFAFGKFLKKSGFAPHAYNAHELDPEEAAGIEAYRRLYPDLKNRLKVFKKKIVDTGVELKDAAKAELLKLTPEELAVVTHGLDVKLGSFEKSGRVSYRYDLCPICAYTGSSEQDSDNCKKCCIYLTCLEPFREQGRFKEDYEVSGAYFAAMLDFLRRHKMRK
ncbi:hypothetical protein A3C96_03800 [Candidatus Uhrbacteria bacterium RIFCSPHIGHO2_02_FULL_60_10]|uniref:N-acetyltransferase domain-containing protein n=1 Tax=Candidatus Uhrbacteria bacterium RIFCSPHIGHO2_02_FULL_60_10 TaxID=1802392 RepID=A0A1F7U806_9BACT|nr:MAG: hypothetical protein A3C96_03800 [Candidatus Uhrbacteria bacterium RIFCSPHIGHO2_02_FULL_60_10]